MDLEALVEVLVSGTARAAASGWLAELSTITDGATVRHHIEGEANLPSTPEGLHAVGRFAQALSARAAGDPIQWYKDALRDTALDLVVQGPPADPMLPDALCRLADAWTVWQHLGRNDKPPIPAASVGTLRHQGIVERWLRDVVCSPSYMDALDSAQQVSADPRSVFCAFENDRNTTFPRGTPANLCRQIVGLDPRPTPTAQALLKYRRANVGPTHVPTAFDAAIHRHFLPPAAGAPCGTTKNLMNSDGSGGVREVVVRPFFVSMLQQPEFIQA